MILNLGKGTRYALYAAMEMARAPAGRPVTAAQVAARYDVPPAVFAKVFQRLVHAGLAEGHRGSGGGYRLVRPPSEVTMLDIIGALERPAPPGSCLLLTSSDDPCGRPRSCRLHQVISEVDELARSTFASISLETLVAPRQPGGAPATRV